MTDLIEFLSARLDEDVAVALATRRDVSDQHWDDGGPYGESVTARDSGGAIVVGPYEYLGESIRQHIARHDPARVLAEVEAKRQIIEALENSAESQALDADDRYEAAPAAPPTRPAVRRPPGLPRGVAAVKTLAIIFWTACAIAAYAWAHGDERAVNGVIGAGFVAIVLTILAVTEHRS